MYIADLHIHSRYSRATSRDCTPEYLDFWARKKGISILGTGDFTHPAWREELKEKLVPAEEGLYRLKEEFRIGTEGALGATAPRFVISGEISSIYKKGGKVRKVHNVILLPGLEEAGILSKKLESIGNIHSDGRPILGLDCHDLLEITLLTSPRAVLIPAHIWTPHFSLFGAFSGFDRIEDCFGDLTPHIHALETGLSSDPPMNWRISALDRFQLVSNSDAHSPSKLGREANLLDIELSYQGLADAIQTGQGLLGTIEFFPEEGKYHYDGHRKCNLCLTPLDAEKYGGICPVCGKKLTIGVSHRIEQLADRAEGFTLPNAKVFESLVPLPEVIAASTGLSAASKKVNRQFEAMLQALGSEFHILREVPIEAIRCASGYFISEGIRRLREGKVERIPGYDGEYGTIRLFERSELENLDGQLSFFSAGTGEEPGGKLDLAFSGELAASSEKQGISENPMTHLSGKDDTTGSGDPARKGSASRKTLMRPMDNETAAAVESLNEEQSEAVTALSRAIVVAAGPGTGKTKTLVSHALYLLRERRVKASEITAVTFTRKAAEEMRERLETAVGGKRAVSRMRIGTFHSICFDLLKSQNLSFTLADDLEVIDYAGEVIRQFELKLKPSQFLRQISLWKTGWFPAGHNRESVFGDREWTQTEEETGFGENLRKAFEAYGEKLRKEKLLDYDDLLIETLRLLEEEKKHEIRKKSFTYLLVDEFQDISPLQYELIRAWNREGKELFVIGDPDQAIYSFRGSDPRCFSWLSRDYREVASIRLEKNYRSAPQIVYAACAVIDKNQEIESEDGRDQKNGAPLLLFRKLLPVRKRNSPVRIVTSSGGLAEGIFAAKEITRLIGGIDMLDSEQQGLSEMAEQKLRSFSDIAILARTHHQLSVYEKCLRTEGIPYVVAGREDFLMEPEVRGTICFFRYLWNEEDTVAARRALKLLWDTPEEGFQDAGAGSMLEKYKPKMKKEKPRKILEDWIEDMDFQENEPMQKLIGTAAFYKRMGEFMEAIVWGSESDLKRCSGKTYTSDCVTLMTVHGAKGLEFPVVMLGGLHQGRFPLENRKQQDGREEERRLFYVGMTRARDDLILVTSKEPSVFLKEIPEEFRILEKAGRKKETSQMEQMDLFDFIGNPRCGRK